MMMCHVADGHGGGGVAADRVVDVEVLVHSPLPGGGRSAKDILSALRMSRPPQPTPPPVGTMSQLSEFLFFDGFPYPLTVAIPRGAFAPKNYCV